MANNEVSGIVINLALAKYVQEHIKCPRYTYRFVFVPETIGSVIYIKKHLDHLKDRLKQDLSYPVLVTTEPIRILNQGTEIRPRIRPSRPL